MTTFVLVHGAWHGSWCWKRVRKSLQARGHDVFTPTLTGVGERSHLGFGRHVGAHADGLGAGGPELLNRSIERGLLDVGDHHAHACACEPVGERAAHAARSARDHRGLPLQRLHADPHLERTPRD